VNGHADLAPLLGGADLPLEDRKRLAAHLCACAACRAEIADKDPSLLFVLLAAEGIPDGIEERVSLAAVASFAHERRGAARRRIAWAALAASLAAAAVLGAYMWRQAAAPAPARMAAALVGNGTTEAAATPTGMIEVLDSPGTAEVVEISVGDLEVFMIFDKAMGI